MKNWIITIAVILVICLVLGGLCYAEFGSFNFVRVGLALTNTPGGEGVYLIAEQSERAWLVVAGVPGGRIWVKVPPTYITPPASSMLHAIPLVCHVGRATALNSTPGDRADAGVATLITAVADRAAMENIAASFFCTAQPPRCTGDGPAARN